MHHGVTIMTESKRNRLLGTSNRVRRNQDTERESNKSPRMAKAKDGQRDTEVLRTSKLL